MQKVIKSFSVLFIMACKEALRLDCGIRNPNKM